MQRGGYGGGLLGVKPGLSHQDIMEWRVGCESKNFQFGFNASVPKRVNLIKYSITLRLENNHYTWPWMWTNVRIYAQYS